jgi:cellobiose phosphorylase
LIPKTGDADFDTYVGRNLPFQVYYQTFVSRAFAWTQKSYRETGFREIQDIYASMYYMVSAGNAELVRELISMWARNVFRAGYANHDFTWVGKEPGDCSDDQLWLVQAVYRYVTLTDDIEFLKDEIAVADGDGTRTLWETLMAILCYSGCISVGAHGLPLLDKADWNDTLRLDKYCMKGPEKEALYNKQLKETGEEWGVPLRNTLTESCMNACLLKIAADQIAELSVRIDMVDDGKKASKMADCVAQSMQKNAWKGNFFARALINDNREGGYTYFGASKDGLSADFDIDGTYDLTSFSWSILADIADEKQIGIMLDVVEKYLKTDSGLKLCTPIRFELLGVNTPTALYFPGDRENGGVFKHAAMMATVASLKAAKTVKDTSLAKRLANLAFYMMEKTFPHRTIKTPYETKGSPRFCTQYNNSETGENIGPILSGTASWLALAVFEMFGFVQKDGMLSFSPILSSNASVSYRLNLDQNGTALTVEIETKDGAFRVGGKTEFTLDGKLCSDAIPIPRDKKEHVLRIFL